LILEKTFQVNPIGSSKPGKYWRLFVRLQLVAMSDPAQCHQEHEPSGGEGEQQRVGQSPLDDTNVLEEDQINKAAIQANCITASLGGSSVAVAAQIITDVADRTVTVSSSASFELVCEYVEKLVNIGAVLSEVGKADISRSFLFMADAS
jgi:hypothetical protein